MHVVGLTALRPVRKPVRVAEERDICIFLSRTAETHRVAGCDLVVDSVLRSGSLRHGKQLAHTVGVLYHADLLKTVLDIVHIRPAIPQRVDLRIRIAAFGKVFLKLGHIRHIDKRVAVDVVEHGVAHQRNRFGLIIISQPPLQLRRVADVDNAVCVEIAQIDVRMDLVRCKSEGSR